ncbi:MHC class II transactivator isoform X2 [Bufo bufo]|uniref:MHC class II transactivator isoform X2 n=1 Tax=Bufo bufo TaxID=8384 RepID=UPI001ABE505B|nr:MHC class II transactivator isoform X2 [Bufo bufo]
MKKVDDLSVVHSTESCLKLLYSDLDVACALQDADMEDFEDITLNFQDCKDLFTDDFVSTLTTVDISDIEELVNYTNGDGNNRMDDLLNVLSETGEYEEEPVRKRSRKNCTLRKSPHSQKSRQKRRKKCTDITALNESCTENETPYSISSTDVPFLFTPAGSLVRPGNTSSGHPSPFTMVPSPSFQIITKIIFCPAPSPGLVLSGLPDTHPIPITEHPALSTNTSIPPSPDRNESCSPFAPSASDLPNSPEVASMYHIPSIEIMNSFIEAQKQLYHKIFALERDFQYTETALINSRICPKAGKVISKTAEKELLHYDLAERERETLQLLNLFEDKDRKEMETKIIALLGQSGMGKTVLVKKICHEWSTGKFGQFSFVFYFECRHLDVSKQFSFKDFLFKLSSCAPVKNIDVYQYILRNPEKVLLIFDGFDEFQDPEGLLHGSFTTSPSKTNKVKDLFTGLFQKKLLRGCTLLLTARVKEKLNQYLGKVDKIIEMMGFSSSQVEWYIKEYFKERPDFSNALEWIKSFQYVFTYCYIPFMCKMMCLFAEENLKSRNKELPLSLAALYYDLSQKNLHASGTCFGEGTLQNSTVDLSCLDFESDKKTELELQTPKPPSDTENTMELMTSSALVQNFSSALNTLASTKDRNLVRYVSFDPKKRRNQESCPDVVRRFLVGLLFHDNGSPILKFTKSIKTQKKIAEYFRTLQLSELCPHRLLEVLHCVYETNNTRLMRSLVVTLDEELSFVGTRLTPPDVFVLKKVLKMSKAKVSLDLRKTSIDYKGLKELVCLKSISSFRASLSDTVNLWKTLLANGQNILLKKCINKFTLEPFKVESLKDVTDLVALVDIQNDICNGSPDSSLDMEIPAVKNLRSVIFGVGKKHGQDGFLKLVEIVPKLPALQHLDLNNLTENHIGDRGVEKLAETFAELQYLQTLDLSQNNISSVGAKELAAALPSLHSLQTLSLFNNNICDMGAEQLASILPDMTSLEALHLDLNRISCTGAEQLAASLQKCPKMRSLRMYNMTIPHAALQRLQQRDSRISCLSIG